MEYAMVYVTCADRDECRRIAAALVEERLAACANMFAGMTSCYHWQGEIAEDEEHVLIAKTKGGLVRDLIRRVEALHSYETPCVVALPIQDGNPDFLAWISESTK